MPFCVELSVGKALLELPCVFGESIPIPPHHIHTHTHIVSHVPRHRLRHNCQSKAWKERCRKWRVKPAGAATKTTPNPGLRPKGRTGPAPSIPR